MPSKTLGPLLPSFKQSLAYLLFLLFSLIAWFSLRLHAYREADEYAIDIARHIHKQCEELGECPSRLPDWESVRGTYYLTRKSDRDVVMLYFHEDKAWRKFQIIVKHGLLGRLSIVGGVDSEFVVGD